MFVLNFTYKKKCNRGINDNEYESKCLETSFVWKIIKTQILTLLTHSWNNLTEETKHGFEYKEEKSIVR